MNIKLINLTLTRVVFECNLINNTCNTIYNLTLTRVVFEFCAENQEQLTINNLTLTRVVFELKSNGASCEYEEI